MPRQQKAARLKEAVDFHSKVLMQEAVNGKGVDRHLLGLKILAMEEGNSKLPAIFTDKSFSESNTWRLSTSNMPGQTYISGFGPGITDGYGVCYGTRKSMLQFSITNYAKKITDSNRFRDTLAKALHDMGALFAEPGRVPGKL